jgi:hypothetical protein
MASSRGLIYRLLTAPQKSTAGWMAGGWMDVRKRGTKAIQEFRDGEKMKNFLNLFLYLIVARIKDGYHR